MDSIISSFPQDVREVYFGEKGILAGLKVVFSSSRYVFEGGIVVDMTTSQPSLAVEIYEAGKKKGIASLDAPGKLLILYLIRTVSRRNRSS